MPMIRGGTPATVAPTNLARMGCPNSMALDRFIRRIPAASAKSVTRPHRLTCQEIKHTSVSHLTGIATSGLVTKLGHGRSDLAEGFDGGAISGTLILGESDRLLFAGLGVLDLCGDGDDLVVEPSSLLSHLGTSETLVGIFVLHSSGDIEIIADVLRGLDHGLQTIRGLLVGKDLWGKRQKLITAHGHALGAEGDSNVNATIGDLVGNVLDGLEARRAESVDAAGGGSVGESSSQHGGSDLVRGSCIGDISEADILDQGRVDFALLKDLFQQSIDDVVEAGVFEASLLALGECGPDGQGDDNVIGVLLGAGSLSVGVDENPGDPFGPNGLTWQRHQSWRGRGGR